MRYALDLSPDDNGTLLVTSRDIPELASFGDDVSDALAHGLDALITALAGRVSDREPIPRPRARGTHHVELPALIVAKLSIYGAMLEQNLRKADMVRRLGWKPVQVDRLLKLTHASRLDQIEQALQVLGKRLAVEVKDAA